MRFHLFRRIQAAVIQRGAIPNDEQANTTVMVLPPSQNNADQKAAKRKVQPTAKLCRFEAVKQRELLGTRGCVGVTLAIVQTWIAIMMGLLAND